jgi:hypothetical protein
MFFIDWRDISNPSILLESVYMLRVVSIGQVYLKCAQSCNQPNGSICWLEIIQTSLHWQKRSAHSTLVLGKAFPIPFQSILMYFTLTFYVAMSTWLEHEIQLVFLIQTKYLHCFGALLIESLSIVPYWLERHFLIDWRVISKPSVLLISI